MDTEPQHPIDGTIELAHECGSEERASFWWRVLGTLVDYMISGAGSFAIAVGLVTLLLPHVYTQTAWVALLATAVLLPSGLVFAYRWVANSMGGTIGKRIVGVRVVRAGTDRPAGLGTGSIRTMMSIVSGAPFGLGYLWAAWDSEGKTWHDKAARTSVVKIDSNRRGRFLLISGLSAVGLSLVAALGVVHVNGQVRRFRMVGQSMEPAFHKNELVIAVKHGSPGRGDVIVFRFPLDPSRDFVERVIGVPGDTVEVRDQKVFVNGSPLKEDYIKDAPNYTYPLKTVPPGMYYVLGDNRRNSFDSHAWGSSCSPQQLCDFVPEANIIGQILH